jgi:hypothetical protein
MMVSYLETILVRTDTGPWNMFYRFAVGFLTPLFVCHFIGDRSLWVLLLSLLCVLLLLRLVPAVARRIISFSDEAKAVWARRRQLAKRYDSYQWQKLFWIGAGLAFYELFSGDHVASTISIHVFCLLSGGIGLARWFALPANLRTSTR